MKQSDINLLTQSATAFFSGNGLIIPPGTPWLVTDFGLGDWTKYGLVRVAVKEEPGRSSKLLYGKKGMTVPVHAHFRKEEDITCLEGEVEVFLWTNKEQHDSESVVLKINGALRKQACGDPVLLKAGNTLTIPARLYHEFCPVSAECLYSEISTQPDDPADCFFIDPSVTVDCQPPATSGS
jgi:D-lyxose ketol-isomerase